MARRRHRQSPLPQRDYTTQSLASLLRVLDVRPLPTLPVPALQSDDRRLFHPAGYFRPAGGLSRLSRALKLKKPTRVTRSDRFAFTIPGSVAVCVRRKRRREVIHALGKAGAGARARHRRRNYLSEVSCR